MVTNKYNCPVVTFTADIGQGEELTPVKEKAKSLGVKEIFIENLQKHLLRITFFQCLGLILFMRAVIF